jgi:hypothetical protein
MLIRGLIFLILEESLANNLICTLARAPFLRKY